MSYGDITLMRMLATALILLAAATFIYPPILYSITNKEITRTTSAFVTAPYECGYKSDINTRLILCSSTSGIAYINLTVAGLSQIGNISVLQRVYSFCCLKCENDVHCYGFNLWKNGLTCQLMRGQPYSFYYDDDCVYAPNIFKDKKLECIKTANVNYTTGLTIPDMRGQSCPVYSDYGAPSRTVETNVIGCSYPKRTCCDGLVECIYPIGIECFCDGECHITGDCCADYVTTCISFIIPARINLALGRPVTVSTLDVTEPKNRNCNVVDGNKWTDFNAGSGTCYLSDRANNNPNWVLVDLEDLYKISSVTVTNRLDSFDDRMQYFYVGLLKSYRKDLSKVYGLQLGDYPVCGQYPKNSIGIADLNIECEFANVGRYVYIQSYFTQRYINFCEIEVFGNTLNCDETIDQYTGKTFPDQLDFTCNLSMGYPENINVMDTEKNTLNIS